MSTVLVVDDDPDTRVLVGKRLSKAGHAVLFADCGGDGVNRTFSDHPDLVLMDIRLVTFDGLAAAGLLRQLGYRGIIVALTALPPQPYQARAIKAGCNDFIGKPIGRDFEARLAVLLR